MPKKKLTTFSDEHVRFMAENKSDFPTEQFFIDKAMEHFIAHVKKERYEKMLNTLKLNQYDTD